MPTFFTNRALCYLKLQSWELAAQDCRRALDMDPILIKGHFFLGQALTEIGSFDEAIKHLTRAIDLARDHKMNYGEEIAQALRHAKKRRWSLAEEKRMQEEIALESYLTRLIEKDRMERLARLRGDFTNAMDALTLDEPHSGPATAAADNPEKIPQIKIEEPAKEGVVSSEGPAQQASPPSAVKVPLDPQELQTREEELNEECDSRLAELQSLFAQLDDRRKKRDVPDYLCGKISFEVLREPVVTPSGITYDRKDIEDHLQRVGHFDPVTRTPLTAHQLIPNLSMKEVVDTYLQENEWANYY